MPKLVFLKLCMIGKQRDMTKRRQWSRRNVEDRQLPPRKLPRRKQVYTACRGEPYLRSFSSVFKRYLATDPSEGVNDVEARHPIQDSRVFVTRRMLIGSSSVWDTTYNGAARLLERGSFNISKALHLLPFNTTKPNSKTIAPVLQVSLFTLTHLPLAFSIPQHDRHTTKMF